MGLGAFEASYGISGDGSNCVYVVLKARSPLPPGTVLGGGLKIYDVLGAMVADISGADDVIACASRSALVIRWDGKNLNGRIVGRGQYQARLSVSCAAEMNIIITKAQASPRIAVMP